jgi:hypothetical protein
MPNLKTATRESLMACRGWRVTMTVTSGHRGWSRPSGRWRGREGGPLLPSPGPPLESRGSRRSPRPARPYPLPASCPPACHVPLWPPPSVLPCKWACACARLPVQYTPRSGFGTPHHPPAGARRPAAALAAQPPPVPPRHRCPAPLRPPSPARRLLRHAAAFPAPPPALPRPVCHSRRPALSA